MGRGVGLRQIKHKLQGESCSIFYFKKFGQKKSRVVQTPVPVGGPPRPPGTCDDLKAQVQWSICSLFSEVQLDVLVVSTSML